MRSSGAFRGTASATRAAQAASPMPAAATNGRPPRMAAEAPAPASRMPDGEVMARATRGVFARSGRRSSKGTKRTVRPCAPRVGGPLEVADDGGEDPVDSGGVGGVVGGGVGGLGDVAQ